MAKEYKDLKSLTFDDNVQRNVVVDWEETDESKGGRILNKPTKLSQFKNDSGFITRAVDDLANYYLKSETYTKDEIKQLIGSIPKFSIQVVTALPSSNISPTTVYLLNTGNESDNLYTEYIYVNGKWEYLGKQTVDLSGYALKTEVPTKLSQLTNDSGYLVTTQVNSLISTALSGYSKTSHTHPTYESEIDSLKESIANYLPKNQGTANVGKILVVGTDGNLTLTEMPEGGASGDVIGTLDESNNILLSGNIAIGTYALVWVDDEGNTTGSGTLEVKAIEPDEPVIVNLAEPNTTNTTDFSIWCNNARMGSDATYRSNSGTIVTNYIKANVGDTFYIQGLSINTSSSNTNNMLALFDSSKTKLTVGAVSDAVKNGNVTCEVTDTTIILSLASEKYTNTEYIRFGGSLKGTIDDVIITKNQPLS